VLLFLSEFPEKIANKEYWVSGTDKDSKGNFRWCSANRMFNPSEVFWTNGELSKTGECVFLQNSNVSMNYTSLSTAKCSEEKLYSCEVRIKGGAGATLQIECMKTWNISIGTAVFSVEII
jgi:hypothetical protein